MDTRWSRKDGAEGEQKQMDGQIRYRSGQIKRKQEKGFNKGFNKESRTVEMKETTS